MRGANETIATPTGDSGDTLRTDVGTPEAAAMSPTKRHLEKDPKGKPRARTVHLFADSVARLDALCERLEVDPHHKGSAPWRWPKALRHCLELGLDAEEKRLGVSAKKVRR